MKNKIVLLSIINQNMRGMYEDYGSSSIAATMRSKGFDVLLLSEQETSVSFQEIIDFKPFIIGFSVYKVSKESVYRVCRRLKVYLPDAIFIAGGIYPSYNHIAILQECPEINAAIWGEGEAAFADLVQAYSGYSDISDVPNVTYRRGESIQVNKPAQLIENLDALPFESRDILKRNKLRVAQISTSRGCTGHCTFCAKQLFWAKWRGRSVANVVKEIEEIQKLYGIDAFYFIDSSLEDPDGGKKRLWDLINEILHRKLKIYFFANFRADFVRTASPELMRSLVSAGLCGACIGLESFNDDDLKLYGKIATAEDNHRIIKLFRQFDIHIQPGFININPYTTLHGLRQNIRSLKQYKMLCNRSMFLNQLSIFQGTAIHKKLQYDGLIKKGEFRENGYNFVNSAVEKLVEFLQTYIALIPDHYNRNLNAVSYLANDFMTLFHYFKRKYGHVGPLTVPIQSFDHQIHQQIDIINEIVAVWYERLLDFIEQDRSNPEITAMSNELLLSDRLKKTADSMHELKNNLFIEAARAGTGYLDDLTRVVF